MYLQFAHAYAILQYCGAILHTHMQCCVPISIGLSPSPSLGYRHPAQPPTPPWGETTHGRPSAKLDTTSCLWKFIARVWLSIYIAVSLGETCSKFAMSGNLVNDCLPGLREARFGFFLFLTQLILYFPILVIVSVWSTLFACLHVCPVSLHCDVWKVV